MPRRLCIAFLAAWVLPAAWAAPAGAQHRPIFDRFLSEQAAPATWQVLPEIPVFLRPQADPDADITQNRGLNLGITFRPRNRVYFTRSYNFAQMAWEPEEGSVREVRLTTFDVSTLLNFSIERVFIVGLGAGLGVMDGIIKFTDGQQKTRLEPFVPLHLGFGVYPLQRWMVSLRVSQAFFLGPGPVVSATRGLIGIGYNF